MVELLKTAAASRVSAEERDALAAAAGKVKAGDDLDAVAAGLPSMRYAKGLVMALGWASEAMDAIKEFERHRASYLEMVK